MGRVILSISVILVGLVAFELFGLAVPRLELTADHLRPTFSISNPSPYLSMRHVRWHCDIAALGSRIGLYSAASAPTVAIAPRGSLDAQCFPTRFGNKDLMASIAVEFTTLAFTRTTKSPVFHWPRGER